MSRVTMFNAVSPQLVVSENSNTIFEYSIRAKMVMANLRRSNKEAFCFATLRDKVAVMLRNKKMDNEFQFRLMMSASDPATFLNLMVGWRNGVTEQVVLDQCIEAFRELYSEIYDAINQQAPIHKP